MFKNKAKSPWSLMYMTVIILCAVILPFNILSLIVGGIMISSARQVYRQSVTASLVSYSDRLDQRIKNIDYSLYDFPSNNASFIRYFQEYSDWHYDFYRYDVGRIMDNLLQLSDSADSMFCYIPAKNDLLVVNKHSVYNADLHDRIDNDALLSTIRDRDKENGKWFCLEYNKNKYLVRIISEEDHYIGAYINCSKFITKMQESSVFRNKQLTISDKAPASEKGFLLCQSGLSEAPVTLFCKIRNADVTGSISAWMWVAFLFLLLSLLMVPIFIYLFRKHIDHPLVILRKAFHELQGGNENYRIRDRASSAEFTDTYLSFNRMAENIMILRRNALEEEQHKHELEIHNLNLQLDNLQLQIRPHFLQNMMNLLFTLVQNRRNENAKELILYLSGYFRYMFRRGHSLELFDKEMELVREYLNISGMHYANAFTVSYQIDPILSLIRIPPLLIHNFVENTIQHAIEPGHTIHIVIYGEYDEDLHLVTLQISDDGRGMDPKFADMINRNDFSSLEEGKHIGIRNSINRLKYYYKGAASVSVESVLGEGTTFTIRIPYDLSTEEMGE
ncbi:MAG: histidine kinase [Lachnospiraceae bacterium]|jgi:two-component system sensor histidine kinase YesM|nr:histidine kinase [Lachnospiraceae bacterium]